MPKKVKPTPSQKKLAKLYLQGDKKYSEIADEIGVRSDNAKSQAVYNRLKTQGVKIAIEQIEQKRMKSDEFNAEFARKKFIELASDEDHNIQLGAVREVAKYTMIDSSTQAAIGYDLAKLSAKQGDKGAQAMLSGLMDRLRASSAGPAVTIIEQPGDSRD